MFYIGRLTFSKTHVLNKGLTCTRKSGFKSSEQWQQHQKYKHSPFCVRLISVKVKVVSKWF